MNNTDTVQPMSYGGRLLRYMQENPGKTYHYMREKIQRDGSRFCIVSREACADLPTFKTLDAARTYIDRNPRNA